MTVWICSWVRLIQACHHEHDVQRHRHPEQDVVDDALEDLARLLRWRR
jgi:hypothetical protein